MISVHVVDCKRHRVHRGPLPPRYGSDNKRPVEIKLKAPQQLQEVLNIAKGALAEAKADQHADSDADSDGETKHGESLTKLRTMVHVLERGGAFQGINRKVQLKPLKTEFRAVSQHRDSILPHVHSMPNMIDPRVDVSSLNPSLAGNPDLNLTALTSVLASKTPKLRRHNSGPAKAFASMKLAAVSAPRSASRSMGSGDHGASGPGVVRELSTEYESDAADDEGCGPMEEVVVEAQLVLKWGGVLTEAGRQQAFDLGTRFRQSMYPGESMGLLRLHSTYRHDLKIYSSDEGRVQMTAAAFAKAFLDLDGDITPILASLVWLLVVLLFVLEAVRCLCSCNALPPTGPVRKHGQHVGQLHQR